MKLPLENILFAGLKIVINQVLPIVILPYLMKRLDAHLFGLMMIAQTVSLFGVATVEYGFNLTGVRQVALAGGDRLVLQGLYRDINLLKLIFCLGCALVLAVFCLVAAPPADLVLALACGFLTVLGAAVQPNWFFMGLEKFKDITFSQVISRAVCLLAIFVLVNRPQDYVLALVLFFLPTLLSGLIQRVLAGRFLAGVGSPMHRIGPGDLSRLAREGVDVYLSQLAATLFASVNTLVLGIFIGAAESGRYAFAEKIMRGVAVLSTPVTEAIFPRVVAGFDTHLETALVFLRRILLVGAVAYLVVAILSTLGFDTVVKLLALQRAADIRDVFAIIAIVPGLIFINNICGTQIVLGLGHARLFRNVILVSGFIAVLWSLVLVQILQVTGAAWALLLGEIGICAGMMWASFKVVGRAWLWR